MAMKGVFVLYVPPTNLYVKVDICHCVTSHINHVSQRKYTVTPPSCVVW